jgi:hypothetical protein
MESRVPPEVPMTECRVETPEERRERYLRLARAAADAAQKTPLPEERAAYLKFAISWSELAEDIPSEHVLGGHPPKNARPSTGLNAKLNQGR